MFNEGSERWALLNQRHLRNLRGRQWKQWVELEKVTHGDDTTCRFPRAPLETWKFNSTWQLCACRLDTDFDSSSSRSRHLGTLYRRCFPPVKMFSFAFAFFVCFHLRLFPLTQTRARVQQKIAPSDFVRDLFWKVWNFCVIPRFDA